MAYGLWDQINWLTTRVKRLCCAVDKNTQAIAQEAINNPPYFEVTWSDPAYFWTKVAFANTDMGSDFKSMINVGNTQRFYGGNNISLINPVIGWTSANANYLELVSINDMGGVIAQVGTNVFEDCSALEFINLPKADLLGVQTFKSCGILKYVNIPNAPVLGLETFNSCSALQILNINKCTGMGTDVFLNVSSANVTIKLPSALVTDPNIVALQIGNTVTLIIV
jgi:hypothetical protein